MTQFNQSEAARLHKAGIKLVPLHHLRKRPEGNAWNQPEHFVSKVDLAASGYGIPLAANGLCSIDPDQMDMATVAFHAVGFDLDKIMDDGVRTTSTRPGSGGRAAFEAMDSLTWFSFSVRMAGQKESTTVFELRAGSPNLQDCCPGVAYQTVKLVNGVEVVSDAIYRQEYANNGETTFDKAPSLDWEFAGFWEKLSEDPVFRRDAEQKMVTALVAAGYPVEPVFNLRFTGKKLAVEINPQLRAKFNAAVTVESVLTRHDYLAPKRKGGRWASPGSTGAPSIRLIPGHESLWQSDHQSDPLNGTFDAAQASVVLDHGYDVAAFERWVSNRIDSLKHMSAQITWNETDADLSAEYWGLLPAAAADFEPDPGQPVRPLFSAYDELVAGTAAPVWVIKGVLEANTMSALAGPPKVGKSFIAYDMGLHVAAGLPWAGREVKQGAVFVIAGEGHGGISRRLLGWKQKHQEAAEKLPFYVTHRAMPLNVPEAAQGVCKCIEELVALHGAHPEMIIIDTLSRNFTGEENSNTDVANFVAAVDKWFKHKFKAAVLIVHHSTKDGGQSLRGASALRGALDALFVCDGAPQGRGLMVQMVTEFLKDGETPEPMSFDCKRVVVGHTPDMDEISTLVPVLSLGARRDKGDWSEVTNTARNLHKLLVEMYDDAGCPIQRSDLLAYALKRGVVTRGKNDSDAAAAEMLRRTIKSLEQSLLVTAACSPGKQTTFVPRSL